MLPAVCPETAEGFEAGPLTLTRAALETVSEKMSAVSAIRTLLFAGMKTSSVPVGTPSGVQLEAVSQSP